MHGVLLIMQIIWDFLGRLPYGFQGNLNLSPFQPLLHLFLHEVTGFSPGTVTDPGSGVFAFLMCNRLLMGQVFTLTFW